MSHRLGSRELLVQVPDDRGPILAGGEPADERPRHAGRGHDRRLSGRSFKPDHIRAWRSRASVSTITRLSKHRDTTFNSENQRLCA
jgi:hypothetical protein